MSSTNPPVRGEEQALLAGALATSHSVLVLQREAEEREAGAKEELSRQLAETAEAKRALQRLLEEQKRVEGELRATENRYRTLFECAPDPVFLLSTDPADAGRILDANELAARSHGFTREELLTLNIADLSGAEPARVSERLAQILAGGRLRVEVVHRRKNGEEFPVEVTASRVDIEGRSYILSFNRDITDRKKAETALQESEARWRFALDGAGDGLWDWNLETGAVFYSRRWKSMLGYADAELENYVKTWEQLIHPDDLPQALKALDVYFQEGSGSHVVEHRMRCRDGSWKWIMARGKIIEWSASGKPRRMIGTHTDIDKAKRQDELQEALVRRLDLVMRASGIGVWELDLKTGLLVWDDAMHALYGMAPEDLRGSIDLFRGCVHPDDIVRVDGAMHAMREGVPTQLIEFRIIRRMDGAIRTIEGNGHLLRDNEGAPHRLLGMNRDITEQRESEISRRQLEAQLGQAQKMETLGTLAGGIAHDFNNLLTGIIGCIELSLPLLPGNHRAVNWLQRARGAGLRASDLVKRLMLFSRRAPNSGRKPMQLGQLVNETIPILKASLPASIVMRTQKDASTGDVLADHGQIQQVLMNLCLNAAHAIGSKQGLITVEVRPARIAAGGGQGFGEGPYACLSVTDDGSGMDEATQSRIFDPFFTTKPEGQGTGLGLAIVHGIVHDHGGTIRLRSAPGQGSCFEIYLPVAAEKTPPLEPKPAASPPVSGKGCRVLVVDDEEAVRSLVEAVLTLSGFEVKIAEDGLAGAACFAATPEAFDFAIVDLSMPGRNGLELIAEMRSTSPGLPVILMSGDHNRYDGIASGAPADSFIRLPKPFTVDELNAAISPLLNANTAPRART